MNQMTAAHALTGQAIQRAIALAQSGDLSGACRTAETALTQGGDRVPLNALLGMFRCDLGEWEKAVHNLRIAYEGAPGDPQVAIHYADALANSGDPASALGVLPFDLASRDPSGGLLRKRGFFAQSSENFEEAIRCYEPVVDRHPDDWESWNNLGNARAALGDDEGSVHDLEMALEHNPESAPTRLNLASALVNVGRSDDAKKHLRHLVNTDPQDKPARIALAGLIKESFRDKAVVKLLEEAAAIDPDDPDLLINLGVEQRHVLEVGKAEKNFRRVLELIPGDIRAYGSLANLYEQTNRENELPDLIEEMREAGVGDNLIAFVEALDHRRSKRPEEGLAALERVGPDIEISRCHQLRGQFCDSLGRYEEAFDAYAKMNEEQAKDPSDPFGRAASYRDHVRKDMATVTPEWAATWRDEEGYVPGNSPIFLVGFPRSGTTLLDTILLSHPEIAILEEEPAVRSANDLHDRFEDLPTLDDDELQRLRNRYFEVAGSLVDLSKSPTLVDKNPLHMNKLPFIHRLFPDAKIRRGVPQPCDVLRGCFNTNFRLNHGMSNFLTLDLAAELYDLSFSYAERARDVLKLDMHTVIYERIVHDRENELRTLFDFIDKDWHDDVMDHQSTARSREVIKTASYAQVVEPIYTRSAGRWWNYREQLKPIFPVIAPWVEKFGYSLDDPTKLPIGGDAK